MPCLREGQEGVGVGYAIGLPDEMRSLLYFAYPVILLDNRVVSIETLMKYLKFFMFYTLQWQMQVGYTIGLSVSMRIR